MTRTRAIVLAIQAIEAEIKRLAVAAHLHEVYGLDAPHAVAASKRRTELRAAIAALQAPEQTRF